MPSINNFLLHWRLAWLKVVYTGCPENLSQSSSPFHHPSRRCRHLVITCKTECYKQGSLFGDQWDSQVLTTRKERQNIWKAFLGYLAWMLSALLLAAFRIHLILTWIRIRILGSTFGKSGSGSSDPPFRKSGSGSEYLFFIRFIKIIISDKLQCLFCYRQNLEKAFLR